MAAETAAEIDSMTETETETGTGMAAVDEMTITVQGNDNTTVTSTTIEQSDAISEGAHYTLLTAHTFRDLYYSVRSLWYVGGYDTSSCTTSLRLSNQIAIPWLR